MSVSMIAAEIVRDTRVTRPDGERYGRYLPLPVIREMLLMLDSLTIAGQRHLMEKVVHFVEGQLPRVAVTLTRRNQLAVSTLLQELRHQSDRLVPDVATFSRGAESLLALLMALE